MRPEGEARLWQSADVTHRPPVERLLACLYRLGISGVGAIFNDLMADRACPSFSLAGLLRQLQDLTQAGTLRAGEEMAVQLWSLTGDWA
jgi:hypothetical protein